MDSNRTLSCGCWTAIAAFILAWTTGYVIWVPQTHRTITAKITKEWVSVTSDGSTNLVGTDQGVFEDQDSALYWKWSSSDYFNNMPVGDTCTFTVVGWRIPLSSSYPNIVSLVGCHK